MLSFEFMVRILFAFIFLGLFNCGGDQIFPYETGVFPDHAPTNLNELNSEYDDMNSNYIPKYNTMSLNFIFSSNSESKGGSFDLKGQHLGFSWSKETADFMYSVGSYPDGNQDLRNQLFEINTDCDEKGPYSLGYFKMLYSRSCGGTHHIFGSSFERIGGLNELTAETFQVSLFPEDFNEMYPTFYGKSYVKDSNSSSYDLPEFFLFSSDKDGAFDIYESEIPAGMDALVFLENYSGKSFKKLDLNTSSNDHMPFVYGDLLVFSSDRPGGFGGYDLYYSLRETDGWSEPENFGSKINSEYDEYRPIVSAQYEFSNQLMIFSSNRPGGLGGFDLYFIGIPKF